MSSDDNNLKKKYADLQQHNEKLQDELSQLSEKAGNYDVLSIADSLLHHERFISRLCHDLRSPLNAVLGFSQIFKLKAQRADPASLVKYVDDIESAGFDLLYLINEVHEYAKLAAHRIKVSPVQVSIVMLLEKIKADAEMLAKKNNNCFELENLLSIESINIDMDIVKAILDVLLHNAFKYTLEGTVTLKVEPHLEQSNVIRFSVADSGIGLSEEQMALLFDEEVQFETAHNNFNGGLGLGLAIARRNAELLDGKIEVACTKGKGCCFSLDLPL